MTSNTQPLPEKEPTEGWPEVDTLQTRFSLEEPLFEGSPKPNPPVASVPTTRWYTQPKALLIMGLLGFLLLLMLITFLLTPKKAPVVEVVPSPSPVVSQVDAPLKTRLIQLKQDLNAADPTKQELPFPPVALELRLAPLR